MMWNRMVCGVFKNRSKANMKPSIRTGLALAAGLVLVVPGGELVAQEPPQVIDLTLERMVDLTLSTSYQIRRLNLGIERDQHNLHAEQAGLKSSVDLDLTIPRFNLTSEPKWNSELQKDEIVQENTRRWEGELSVSQPVILCLTSGDQPRAP